MRLCFFKDKSYMSPCSPADGDTSCRLTWWLEEIEIWSKEALLTRLYSQDRSSLLCQNIFWPCSVSVLFVSNSVLSIDVQWLLAPIIWEHIKMPPKGAFSLASKVHQRKQVKTMRKKARKKKKKETREYEREGHVVLLTIHQYPSVLKAWLRSPVVKYVDEERRKTAREIGGRSD